MLADGVYRIVYHSTVDGENDGDCALAVLRDGRITGSDKHGGVFLGHYGADPATGNDVVKLRFEIPPGGMAITGLEGGLDGTTVEIAASFSAAEMAARTTVDLSGSPVDVEFSFLGPLPA